MDDASQSLIQQLQNLRALFLESSTTDSKLINDYAWLIVKVLNAQIDNLGSTYCRQLLADYLLLPTQRPSRLHSAILSSAVRVSNTFPDFRFAAFLRMWGLHNLRTEDRESQKTQDGKTYPSLTKRTSKALGISLLLHPEDCNKESNAQNYDNIDEDLSTLLTLHGYSLRTMVVTRIKEATGKDGKRYHFITLASPDGFEVETISHNLMPSPHKPLPEGKRHHCNVGQLYNVLLKEETVVEAYLSLQKPNSIFPVTTGYIERIDTSHSHMHIYDNLSRHFVAPVQRFSQEKAGDFVRFIPITPQNSKFKTAIILNAIPPTSTEVKSILREIRITSVNKEKAYASWQLTDSTLPITEMLSSLQLSEGEQSPAFTQGYLNLSTPSFPYTSIPDISTGNTLHALIYLRRGKDRQKRPNVAMIFNI